MSLTIMSVAIMVLHLSLLIQCQTSMSSSTNDAVTIISVSTQLGVLNANPWGSLAGGTRIYMKVTGLDQTASNNQVSIGQYPCLIDDKGVNGLFINCVTSAPDPTDTNLSNLPITVTVVGKAPSKCTFSGMYCFFSYMSKYTPYLLQVAPRSVFPRAQSNWRAIWTINNNDVPYLEGQFFGTNRCDRFSIKDQIVDAISPSDDIVSCQVSGTIEAGYYNLQIKSYTGYQFNDYWVTQKQVFNDNTYQSKVVPLITSMSSNFVSPLGQILLINGYGFSGTPANIAVTVPGSQSNPIVVSSTVNQIEVLIPKLSPTTNKYFYGSTGLRYTRYGFAGTNLAGNCALFRTQILANATQIAYLIVEDNIIPEPETLDVYESNYGQYIRGFIKAPFTTNYRFYLEADDCASVYIQTNPDDTTQSTMILASNNTAYTSPGNYWQNMFANANQSPNQISSPIPLIAGKYYYIEIYHQNQGSGGHLKLSLEVDSTGPAKSNQLFDMWQITTSAADGATISGTFRISVDDANGNTITFTTGTPPTFDLPYNVDPSVIVANFYTIFGVKPIAWAQGYASTGFSMFIYTRGITQVNNFKISSNSLVSTNGAVTATITNKIPQSTNMLFEPIPNEILFLQSTTPQVQVSVNGIVAGCPVGVCDFTLSNTKTPTLQSFSVAGAILTVVLQAGSALTTLTTSSLTISFAGADCTGIKQTTANSPTYTYTCNLEQQNGATVNEAGVNVPIIHYDGIGYVLDSDAAVAQAITTNLLVSSVTPSSGTPDGGTLITLVGSGFPKSSSEQFTLTIGGVAVTPTLVSNTKIQLVTPLGTDGTIVLTYNTLSTTSKAFTYDSNLRILISSLQFVTASPVYRGSIVITGMNFGTAVSDLTVTLSNDGKSYPCVVQQVTGGTSIKAYLRGGMPGTYKFTVNRLNYGNSYSTETNAQFQYGTFITGISPNQGSQAGGTIITITGYNFAPSSTSVFIGFAINWYCNVLSVTTTQITCVTPPQANLDGYKSAVDVAVVTDSYLESTCAPGSNCQFTYVASLTPQLTALPTGTSSISGVRLLDFVPNFNNFQKSHRILSTDERRKLGHNHLKLMKSSRRNLLTVDDLVVTVYKTYVAGATETLTGTGFSSPVVVTFSGSLMNFTTPATLSSDGSTITYTIPDMPADDYATYINAPTGNANMVWNTRIQLTVTSVTPTSVGTGGQYITISGGGFNNSNVVIGGYPCQRITQAANQYSTITCRTPQLGAQVWQVNVTQLKSGTTVFDASQSITTISPNTPTIKALVAANGIAYSTTLLATVYTGSPTSFSLSFTGLSLSGTTAVVNLETSTGTLYPGTVTMTSATAIVFSFTNVPMGQYNIVGQIDSRIVFWYNMQQALIVTGQAPTVNNPTTSIAGGGTVTFTGTGFDTNIANNYIEVCGFKCPIISASYNTISCSAPTLKTQNTITAYPTLQAPPAYVTTNDVVITSDSQPTLAKNIFDSLTSTPFQSSSKNSCWVLFDFGVQQFTLTQFMYMPRIDILAQVLIGSGFVYTTDGSTWQKLIDIGQTVHSDWNVYVPDTPIQGIRQIKYQDTTGTSLCQMAEVLFKGYLYYTTTNTVSTPTTCGAQITVNGQTVSVNSAVTYSQSVTPVVQTVSPAYGSKVGGTTVTITGTGFTSGQSTVTIDGIPCSITASSSTQITCTTGVKDTSTNTLRGQFVVSSNGNYAVNSQIFTYANRWSDINTWGGVVSPGDGDSVIINKGETLVVDMLTPKLVQLLSEGAIIFDDSQPTSLNAEYIVIYEGSFTIGTETQPHQNQVTITLSGASTDTQMPDLGNKVLGCHQCTLDIHGVVRTPTWTLLSSTANVGDTTIKVDGPVDWQVGEQIVIASSDVEHMQAETRYITAVGADKSTLTLDSPLVYLHYSAIETYGNQQFPMKVEVGLLTRNIVIQGSAADASTLHGYHLMVHGLATQGAIARISYAEFRYGGQPAIKGRYPIHFHLNGDVAESYVRGNSIHDCFARCVTIHGVHYLTVENNVCYNTFGHAIFLEDGIETDNVIQDNLVIGTKQSWIMLQTDITVATYWITNPQNILRRNRSGGSEWYGFWYEVKDNPDGPSATSDICPPGLNILQFTNNTSHSNGHYGLRIFKLQPRLYACKGTRNDAAPNPFLMNPTIQAQFTNFTAFKNGFCGILAEQIGNVLFDQIMIAESGLAGFQSHIANFTQDGFILQNALIVAQSRGNPSTNLTFYQGSTGIMAPRTNGFLAQNIILYRFPAGSVILQSCSYCQYVKLTVTGGKNSHFKNITILESSSAQIVYWMGPRREIFWDLDGSLTKTLGLGYETAYVTASKPHLQGITGCTTITTAAWNQSVICDSSKVQIRDVLINNPSPTNQISGDLLIYKLSQSNINNPVDPSISVSAYTDEYAFKIQGSNDIPKSMASPFVTGQTYSLHFGFGATDFTSVGIFPSPYFAPGDLGIVFRFNYTSYRQYFDTLRNQGGQLTLNYSPIATIPNPKTCSNGDWYLDTNSQNYFLCMSPINKTMLEFIQIYPVVCRVNCSSVGTVPLETNYRYWSDPNTWASGAVPLAGENATIQVGYQVIMDVDPPEIYFLSVLGSLIFSPNKTTSTLSAHYIWARSGSILAGNATTTYHGKITINILGKFGDTPMLIANGIDTSNKLFVITNAIELYGVVPSTVWTRLTVEANPGDTTITVDGDLTSWQPSDQLILGPSGINPEEQEKVQIVSISGQVVTITPAIQYYHYGAPDVTIVKPGIGQLDMRTAVGHLTRNIQIVGSPTADGWGGRLLIWQFLEPDSKTGIPRRGYGVFQGVEFINMGQYSSTQAGLDMRNLNSAYTQTPSVINGCSFHDSQGMLLNIQQSSYITVTNNVFYNGVKALVQVADTTPFVFNYNLLVYVKLNLLDVNMEMINWAALGTFIYADSTLTTTDYMEVAYNTAHGSQDSGLFIMATPCANSDKPSFHDNECASSVLACFGVTQRDKTCNYITGTHAYASDNGLHAALITNDIKTDKMILVENNINFILKSGTSEVYNLAYNVSNSYMSPLVRLGCTKCYTGRKTYCQGAFSFQMGTATTVAFPPISSHTSDDMDVICTIEGIDQRVYVDNVVFENVNVTYKNFPQCGRNAVFKQHHNAVDMSAQHYLTNTVCKNCQFDALLYNLRDADTGLLGWFGGCGSFICTGMLNILIEDQDGSFFGQVGQGIANNSYFGPNVTYCTRQAAWNGYWCPGTYASILNFVSTAADHDKRLYSPIHLTDGLFWNELNSYKEWNWAGPEPLNTRDSRFVGLVTLKSAINMTNAGTNPTSSIYWLSRKRPSGSPSDWIILKYQFASPQVLQVTVNGAVIQPGITQNNAHWDLLTKTGVCGANNYFFKNYTIHFVLTGDYNCKVTITQLNTLQISTRIQVTTAQFFGSNFLQYAVAQLGGDPYNYFILGTTPSRRLLQGSTSALDITWAVVDPGQPGTAAAAASEANLQAVAAKLSTLAPSNQGFTIESNTVQAVTVTTALNYNTTEPTTSVVLTPGGSTTVTSGSNSGSSSSTSGSSTSNSGSSNTNTGSSSSTNSGTSTSTTDPGSTSQSTTPTSQGNSTVNPNTSENTTQLNNTQAVIQKTQSSGDSSMTVTIIVSVIVSVVGLSFIIAGLIWFKKNRLARIAAMQAQRIDNTFTKANYTEENLNRPQDLQDSNHLESNHPDSVSQEQQ